ncbi:hypothetical protein CUMW_243250 [Citrus unshiu]|nr:hypothetical protein CUMW_243250 [Citrus unshiu]
MHDVVRDVAISVARRDKIAFAVRNEDVWNWPDADALKKYFAICLKDSIINDIPEVLESTQLEFLFMSPKNSFVGPNVPENFFKRTKKLRVLDLTRMRLLSLPSSIDLLVNLRTLCLNQSILGDMDTAIIGKLENLEILSFVLSDIVQAMTEVVINDKDGVEKEEIVFSKLKTLELFDLDSLTSFCSANYTFKFPSLQNLWVIGCPKMKIFTTGESITPLRVNVRYGETADQRRWANNDLNTTIQQLHAEKNKACGGLPIALTTVAKALRNKEQPMWRNALQELQTPSEASFDEGVPVEAYSTIELSYNLRELKLKLDFMDICSMKLQGINNVEYLWLDKLQGVKNVLFDLDTEGFSQLKHLHVQNNPNFLCIVDSMEMVACEAFPLLESLILHNLINIERICIDQLKVESFNELKIIQAYNCDKLSNIFWLSTTKCLPRLERIAVVNCSKMKEIFAIGEEVDNAIEKIEFTQLRSLSLGNLPEVTNFCREVKTPSASPNRPSSQEDTSTLLFNEKEIVSENRADEVIPYFVFPQLTVLILQGLPKLRCLYPGMHTSEWLALENFAVCRCDKLKIFAADLSRNKENNQLDIPAQQPLLPFEKILPNLKDLSLNGKDLKMILQADFPQHLFGSLKQLEIAEDNSACFPIWNVLERFHNLEILSLFQFSFHEEVFSEEGSLEKHAGKLAMIKTLELRWHYHLKQLCKQDSKLGPIFQYLEILKAYHCQSLLILLPSSSVSFQNLTALVAFGCKKLLHMVTSSTAKTLVRLVAKEIYGCRAMAEVVINDKDGVEKEEIVFRKLKTLELRDLDSLTSFCSANYTFQFPSLQELWVIGCPKMKIFTTGESITPLRVNICYGETVDQRRWANNDLNTTIQHYMLRSCEGYQASGPDF